MPRVTVGLPVYNGERYLSSAIESLLAQTFTDFELIVCDNASTDGTQEICERYVRQDPRVRYVRHSRNIGPAANYREALTLSTSSYFRWATHDDLSEPTSLERCVDVLDHMLDAVLAYPRTKLIDADGRVISSHFDDLHLNADRPSIRFVEFLRRVRMCNPIYGLMRRDRLMRTALMGDFLGSDQVLLAELTLYGKFIEIPEALFLRRIHEEAYSSLGNVEKMLAWYDPSGKRRVSLPGWRHYRQYVLAVLRSPIPISEKLAALSHIGRRAVWARQTLLNELHQAARDTVRLAWSVVTDGTRR
jgi:glycosyltransferase involved in cell wall biosynthesis